VKLVSIGCGWSPTGASSPPMITLSRTIKVVYLEHKPPVGAGFHVSHVEAALFTGSQ
jgi:hypothetical protein